MEGTEIKHRAAQPQSHEEHTQGGSTVRDVILGMSDGLTVPFALAAGVSGAVHSNLVVIVAGFAELAAGAISMGLGGYLAAASEVDAYRRELEREHHEVRTIPHEERKEVRDILERYGLSGQTLDGAVTDITSDAETWVRFMMREELDMTEPEESHSVRSGAVIGLSYAAGGIVPLVPYLLGLPVSTALGISAALTLLVLLVFGWIKGHVTGVRPLASSIQTMLIGGTAAGVAYVLARTIAHIGGAPLG